MEKHLMRPSQALKRDFSLPDDSIPAESVPAEDSSGARYGFVAGDLGFLMPPAAVGELFDQLAYCRLPNTPPLLVGMANARGSIVPLFDLYRLFGLPVSNDCRWRFLIIGDGEEAVGIRIDSLPTRVALSESAKLKSHPALPQRLRPHVRACYQGEHVWVDWDVKGCLTQALQ